MLLYDQDDCERRCRKVTMPPGPADPSTFYREGAPDALGERRATKSCPPPLEEVAFRRHIWTATRRYSQAGVN